MKRRRFARIVVGVSAAALVTVGLGISGAGGVTNPADQFKDLKEIKPPNPCKNDPGITDTEIKLGSIVPTTGPSATFAPILEGMKARIAKANAEGETGKRKITLVNEDDGADTARNVTAAQKLVEEEKVFAIMPESAAGDASGKYLFDQGVPAVGWQLGLAVYGTYPNFFGFQNANVKDIKTHYVARPIEALKALGAKKFAIIGNSTGNAATFAEQLADSVDKTKGVELVYKTTDIPTGTTEFGAVVDQIKQSGADTVYTTMAVPDGIALVNALKQASVNTKFNVFPAAYSPQVLPIAAFDGAVMSLEYAPLETTPEAPGMAEYKKWMAQEAPSAVLGQITIVGWLSANAMIEGIKAAGVSCPTRKAFINNLRMVKGYTADGWFEPLNFADVYNRPFFCAYYIKVVNKQFVPQFDGKPFCGKKEIINNKILKELPTTTVAPPTTTAAPA